MIQCPVWDEFHGLNSQFPPVLWHQIHAIYGKVDTEVLATEKFKKHCLSVREKKKLKVGKIGLEWLFPGWTKMNTRSEQKEEEEHT